MIDKQPSPETAKLLLTLIKHTSLPILIEKENKRKQKNERI
jgi:hypothetical protein